MFNLLVSLYVILGILIGIIVILIILYIILSKSKIKDHLKKEEKYIENKSKTLSSDFTEKLILDIGSDTRYRGTFNSFKSNTSKNALKFVKEFVNEICPYALIKENVDSKKYKKLHISFSKDENIKKTKNKNLWTFDSRKSLKSNYKSLVKIANKNKCAKGLVEVLTKVYMHVKDKNTFPENPSAFENNKFITFIVK